MPPAASDSVAFQVTYTVNLVIYTVNLMICTANLVINTVKVMINPVDLCDVYCEFGDVYYEFGDIFCGLEIYVVYKYESFFFCFPNSFKITYNTQMF
jgi:hypothetical protein